MVKLSVLNWLRTEPPAGYKLEKAKRPLGKPVVPSTHISAKAGAGFGVVVASAAAGSTMLNVEPCPC